jgi:alpha-1,2-mannosyltransferase
MISRWERDRPAAGPGPAAGQRLAAAAVPLAAVAAVLTVFVPGVPHYDVGVFLRAGASVWHGRDPYPALGSADVRSGFAFVYPYLVAFPFAPLSWLGRWGADTFIVGSAFAVVAGCRLAGAGTRGTALVLLTSFTITGLQMGTLNALLFLGLILLWRARDRPLAAGVLAALLIYSKLFLAPVWLWLVLTRRWPAAGVAAAATAALVGLGGLVGPIGPVAYVRMLGSLASAEAPDGLSLTGLLMNTGLGAGPATWLARAAALAVLLGCWLARRDDERVLFAAVIGAALLASPIVWSHYLILLSCALLVVAPRADAALAVFALASWPVVNPHHISALGTVVGFGSLALLARRPLVALAGQIAARAARGAETGRRAGSGWAGWGSLAVAVAATAAGIGIALAALLVETAGRPGSARVVGAYCAQVALLACLVWAVQSGEGARGHQVG